MHCQRVFSALLVVALPSWAQPSTHAASLEQWLQYETPIAFRGILDNIGANVTGAQPGIVVASPSRTSPNYFYTWTRDAALTYKCLVDALLNKQLDVETSIQDYVVAQARLQIVSNPSGDLCTGGLAEPKFNVDESAFTGAWGRPQRDGPALRAITLIYYANILLARGNQTLVQDLIWPIVQNDLSYIAQYWNSSTFDLWEEVDSSSFFTTAVQYRALVEGAGLASLIGKTCAYCTSQAPQILCFLQSYWSGAYALANTGGGRSGKDVNSILTSIHLFDQEAGCDDLTFQPCSGRALANHRVVTDSFRGEYPINSGIASSGAVAVGRYPEDVYQGGHPWYLSNFGAAEQLYYAIYQWQKQGQVIISELSLPFFAPLVSNIAAGTYTNASSQMQDIVTAVQAYADGYMVIAQKYTPNNGSLAEQFSRDDGAPLSARDLTWSYAAFVTARNARTGLFPQAWGARSASLPATCASDAAQGPCAAPTVTVWPGRPSTTSAPCTTPSLTAVRFNVLKETFLGDSIVVSGNSSNLGSWNLDQAVTLNASQYTNANPLWTGVVELSGGSAAEYKYVLKTAGGEVFWEQDPNRMFVVPANCQGDAARADTWH